MRAVVCAAMLPLIAAGMASAQASVAATTDPRGLTLADGTWTYRKVAGGSEADFVDRSGQTQASVRCDRAARRVNISRLSATASPTLQIWTSSAARTSAATFDSATLRVSAGFAAYDTLLDALAFSRGRIALTLSGGSPLVIPAWAEPARAVEDCRN